MKNFYILKKSIHSLWVVLFPLLVLATSCTGTDNATVHPYAALTVPETGPGGEAYPSHVRNDALSARFQVKVAETEVAAVQSDNTGFGDQGHNMDIARFASDSRTPQITIRVQGEDSIKSVTIHPVRLYPQESLAISPEQRTVTFRMSEALPYAIVAINGGDPQDACASNPHLTLINDPLEDPAQHPAPDAPNVLNFRTFAENYLREHPIKDQPGDVCRQAGSVTDASLNDERVFTWNYEAGQFVPYTDREVAFPNKRARNRNDVSDALQAALDMIQRTPELNTLYIPAGTYLWSGLRIINWNGDTSKGGKPLFVYTDENALMVNRLKECRESNEPAILIAHSSFVTISGRGIHDGQGCYTFFMDRKDARSTPHQGGVVIRKSSHITFNDTYSRNSQQWNWETHDAEHLSLNNIKGLSPYNHGWIDGLNLSSGRDITVNGSITLGNDDTFASGHYNPSDEFPRRTYTENPSINLVDTDKNPAEIRHTFAAAGIYNQDRMHWTNRSTANIRVRNAIGWTRTAHCIRIGSNPFTNKSDTARHDEPLKSYHFDNFHSIAGRKAIGDIRVQTNSNPSFPACQEIVIRNSSFWTPAENWAQIPTVRDNHHTLRNVVLENLYFMKPIPNPTARFSDIGNLTIKQLHINGQRIGRYSQSGIPETPDNVPHFFHDFED